MSVQRRRCGRWTSGVLFLVGAIAALAGIGQHSARAAGEGQTYNRLWMWNQSRYTLMHRPGALLTAQVIVGGNDALRGIDNFTHATAIVTYPSELTPISWEYSSGGIPDSVTLNADSTITIEFTKNNNQWGTDVILLFGVPARDELPDLAPNLNFHQKVTAQFDTAGLVTSDIDYQGGYLYGTCELTAEPVGEVRRDTEITYHVRGGYPHGEPRYATVTLPIPTGTTFVEGSVTGQLSGAVDVQESQVLVVWNGTDATPPSFFDIAYKVKVKPDLPNGPNDEDPIISNQASYVFGVRYPYPNSRPGYPPLVDAEFNAQSPTVDRTVIDRFVNLEYATVTSKPGEAHEDEIVEYTLTATTSHQADTLQVKNTLARDTELIPGSVTPPVAPVNGILTWNFTDTKLATMKFKLKVLKQQKGTLFVTNRGHAEADLSTGDTVTRDVDNALRYAEDYAEVDAADASASELGGLLLPNAANSALLPDFPWGNTRSVNGVATDGVSLLLLRAKVKSKAHGKVRFSVEETEYGAPPGALFRTADTSIIDTSAEGGARDSMPEGPQQLEVDAVTLPGGDGEKVAFVLYRSPRDFDVAGTEALQKRPVKFKAELLNVKNSGVLASGEKEMNVVRPLVVLQHGTFDTPAGFGQSPLHTNSGNETRGYQGWNDKYPFQTDRGDFSYILQSAGPLRDNAAGAMRYLVDGILPRWRKTTGYAGAQVDIVCHSQGGVVWRWNAQTQPDANVLTVQAAGNFRNITNWGHGMLHKLITVATTHRGSAIGNHTAYLNHNGKVPGLIRKIAEKQGAPIDLGGVEDQMVVAPTLRLIRRTRVPSHALAGSGLVENNKSYEDRLFALWIADTLNGPYQGAGSVIDDQGAPQWDVYRRLSNYGFNLNYDTIQDDTSQNPNYDLTVSSYSSKGHIAPGAISGPDVIQAAGPLPGTSLIGLLTHGDEIFPGAGNPLPVAAVAQRVAFLLRQSTKSSLFANFPAVGEAPLTPTEAQFSDTTRFNPQWLYQQTPGSAPRGSNSPEIRLTPAVTQVVPGQQITVEIAWPGKTLQDALVYWKAGYGGAGGIRYVTPTRNAFQLTVPDVTRGKFPIGAAVTATDGAFAYADIDLELVDATPYVELQVIPGEMELRHVAPAGFTVYGVLGNGTWTALNGLSALQIQSSNPQIVSITSGRLLLPVNFGQVTITVSYNGLTTNFPVSVTGQTVPVSVSPKTRTVLKRKDKAAAEFIFLSGPGFDPAQIARETVMVGAIKATKFKSRDANRDGIKDLVALVAPKLLRLPRGPVTIPMAAATMSGGLVRGNGAAKAK